MLFNKYYSMFNQRDNCMITTNLLDIELAVSYASDGELSFSTKSNRVYTSMVDVLDELHKKSNIPKFLAILVYFRNKNLYSENLENQFAKDLKDLKKTQQIYDAFGRMHTENRNLSNDHTILSEIYLSIFSAIHDISYEIKDKIDLEKSSFLTLSEFDDEYANDFMLDIPKFNNNQFLDCSSITTIVEEPYLDISELLNIIASNTSIETTGIEV